MRAEVEESSEDESARFKRHLGRRIDIKEDTIRLKKEVEDLNLLVERLK